MEEVPPRPFKNLTKGISWAKGECSCHCPKVLPQANGAPTPTAPRNGNQRNRKIVSFRQVRDKSFGRAFSKARGFSGQSPESPVATGEILTLSGESASFVVTPRRDARVQRANKTCRVGLSDTGRPKGVNDGLVPSEGETELQAVH